MANPEEAVIVAVPFATEVTRATECEVPEVEETVATDTADVDHVTWAPLIVVP